MIKIGAHPLTVEDVYQILFQGKKIELDSNALSEVGSCFEFLQGFAREKLIYGINTGFGPMAQYRIEDKDLRDLQYNLIRSHASGMGNPIPEICVKGLMIARLSSLMQGHSGVHPEGVNLLAEFINHDIYPLIFEHGGVGASGDLVQLAHLALSLIGEGHTTREQISVPTHESLEANGLKPISIHLREGLALLNGTSAMTGIGLVNLIQAKNLLNWSLMASSMVNEIVGAYDDHFSLELNQVKPHEGQLVIAKGMRTLLHGSTLIKKRPEHLFDQEVNGPVIMEKVQEYYSLRCIPQVLGPVYDTLAHAEKVLLQELNSVNDNPVIDRKNENVYHGGNFHGDYVSLEMDKIKIVITKLSMLAERQLNYLLNDKLNNKLPPFVNLGVLGLNFGMQGAQFTATSTVAENQTLSFPMSIHSIPNNNDNQDIVSMGTNAAMMTRKVIENAYEVMAIEFLTILQAVEALEVSDKLAPAVSKIYKTLREIVPRFEEDNVKYEELQKVKNHLIIHRLNITEIEDQVVQKGSNGAMKKLKT
ncbi:aromatic amino acid ammonia-lyase [bacterium]|nr:aromatic amino acid ammonia-lyase [bacterium]